MKLSIVIPAYNEEKNIDITVGSLLETVRDKHKIDCEIIIANDSSEDRTADVVQRLMATNPEIRLVNRRLPRGFGRATTNGLDVFRSNWSKGERSQSPTSK